MPSPQKKHQIWTISKARGFSPSLEDGAWSPKNTNGVPSKFYFPAHYKKSNPRQLFCKTPGIVDVSSPKNILIFFASGNLSKKCRV